MHSSTCWLPVEPAPFVDNAVFFPLDGFSSFVKDQVTIGVWIHFWVFNSIPLIYLPVIVPIPCRFFFVLFCFFVFLSSLLLCSTVWGQGWWFPSEVLLLLRIVFAILGFLLFQMNLRIALSNSMKIVLEFWWRLNWICRLL